MQRLADLCVRRPVLSSVITLVMVVLGGISFLRLDVSRYPDVELPIITVITQFPGAGPEEIETDLTPKIEDAVSSIGGIDTVTSTSTDGVSIVAARFVLEKNANVATQEVRDKVGAIPDLPAGIEPPRVLHFDPNQIPVAILALSADRPVRDISEYAARVVEPHLEGTLGVAQVSLVGAQLRQINVRVDPHRLAARGVTTTALLNAIQPPTETLGAGAQRFVMRTFARVSELTGLPIAARGGPPVSLGDVARVEDGAAEPQTTANVNGTPAVLLYVSKQPGANTISVVDAIKERLHGLNPPLPPGYNLRVAWDQSEYVRAATNTVRDHLIAGSLLTALVVWLFLWDWRATTITALAIPISLISTFTLLAALGLTLNTLTLLALALVIGIVIDDAIVVLENIYRLIHEKGTPAFRAAIDGTREVGPAVMATTLSLLVVFLPLAFMSDISGRFMSSFGWTIGFAIAVSLLVSFTLTPSLASRWLAWPPAGRRLGEGAAAGSPFGADAHGHAPARVKTAIESGYRWLLERSLRRRWVLVLLSVLTMASLAPLTARVHQNFLPADDESQFEVAVQAPADSALDATSALGTRMAAEIRRLAGVAYTIVTAGDDLQHSPNKLRIFVRLLPIAARKVTQQQVMARVRTEILPRYRADAPVAVVNEISDISGSAPPLQYVVSGPDLSVLDRASKSAVDYLRTLPGVVDVRSSAAPGRFVDLKVSPARAAAAGLSVGEAANAVALLSQGILARQASFAEQGRFYGIYIRDEVPDRANPLALFQTPVVPPSGAPVSLGQLVAIHPTTAPREIERFNRRRQVTISANLLPDASLGHVVAQLDAKMRTLGLPAEYHLGSTGIAEQVSKTTSAFVGALATAIVLMFLVLAAQFESWVHPITILLSLPLTVPFALISIVFLHGSLNVMSYLGILVLIGVVKKNAILQVDRANRLRAQGMEKHEAIINASLDRVRPILMTTIAFVAGMIPLAVSRDIGSGTNQSISTPVILGQMLSLLLTLVAIPVFYSLFDDLEQGGIKRWLLGKAPRKHGAGRAASESPDIDRLPASAGGRRQRGP